jgi:hypothetical protein
VLRTGHRVASASVQGCATVSNREPPAALRADRLGTRGAITTSYHVVRRTAYRPAVRRPLPCQARLPRSASYWAVKASTSFASRTGGVAGYLGRCCPAQAGAACCPVQARRRCRPPGARRASILRPYHHWPSLLVVPHGLPKRPSTTAPRSQAGAPRTEALRGQAAWAPPVGLPPAPLRPSTATNRSMVSSSSFSTHSPPNPSPERPNSGKPRPHPWLGTTLHLFQ